MKRLLALLLAFALAAAQAGSIVIKGPIVHVAAGGGSAVSVDAVLTGGDSGDGDTFQGDNVSSKSGTFTVGADATLLVMLACWGKTSGSGAPASRVATWNTSETMTEAVVNSVESTANLTSAIYTLVNPTSGAHTIALSWTGTYDIYIGVISFKDTDTTTGYNAAHNQTVTDDTTITITSDANGGTVASFCLDGSTPTMNFTKVWDNSTFGPGGGGSYNLGGTSNAHTFTGAGGLHETIVGIHVIPAP